MTQCITTIHEYSNIALFYSLGGIHKVRDFNLNYDFKCQQFYGVLHVHIPGSSHISLKKEIGLVERLNRRYERELATSQLEIQEQTFIVQ